MAKILLVANLNRDHIFYLSTPLTPNIRHQYQNQVFRLGGGGANTGAALCSNGHQVSILTHVGNDATGDWLLQSTAALGIQVDQVQRYQGATPDVIIMLSPDGERTILSAYEPDLKIKITPDYEKMDALYINKKLNEAAPWMRAAVNTTCVFAQYQPETEQPCHYLIASKKELPTNLGDAWSFALKLAGRHLKAFIVTDAQHGSIAYTQHHQHTQPISPTPAVVDTTGAGDAYCAGLIHHLIEKMSLEQAMLGAAYWASLSVQTNSSLPPSNLRTYHAKSKMPPT
ncbi:MAG: ribokinase [Shewanellaceae bacterium]|nr:ribokinase [Shewanellaceae bacterium]